MRLNRLSYYADFFLAFGLVAGLAGFVLCQATRQQGLEWVVSAVAGVALWSVIEYATHRWLYHRVPFFKDLHDMHHAEPHAHIGAPPVIGIVIIVGVCFVPLASTRLYLACGLTTGLLLGYMGYMLVHHAAHYWRLAPTSWLYRARHHHALHHHRTADGNFGITTAFWDHVFGTAIETRRPLQEPQAL